MVLADLHGNPFHGSLVSLPYVVWDLRILGSCVLELWIFTVDLSVFCESALILTLASGLKY